MKNLNLYLFYVSNVSYLELEDVTIQRVYVRDLPGTKVAFEVETEVDFVMN